MTSRDICIHIHISINYINLYLSLCLLFSPLILGFFASQFLLPLHMIMFTSLAWHLRSSMIWPQVPFQAYRLPVLASCSPTTHSRPHLPENVSSLETIQAQSQRSILAQPVFSLLQVPFSPFPSYKSPHLSPFQTPRPGFNIPPLWSCPSHLLPHTLAGEESACSSAVLQWHWSHPCDSTYDSKPSCPFAHLFSWLQTPPPPKVRNRPYSCCIWRPSTVPGIY